MELGKTTSYPSLHHNNSYLLTLYCSKSQIAIEYCYRFKDNNPNAHALWVYGGNISRFYQGYKRIAQALEIPGWDDPEASILELVCAWLSSTTCSCLLVIDNADNIEHWRPGEYKSGGSLDDPTSNLSKYLPDGPNCRVLITTRDNRVATRLAKGSEPELLHSMTADEAETLFLSKLERDISQCDKSELHLLLDELDHLPLALSQAAAFIHQNDLSVADYVNALRGEEAEEFLDEELDDFRRDEESVNSAFRTWKISHDQIRQQKPRAADLLSLFAMFDRQSVSKALLKVPQVVTSLSVLQSFNLITPRTGSQSFQIHRLVQRFVQLSLQRENEMQRWQGTALAILSKDYPTEIGVAEWPICDALAPHVHVITSYTFDSPEAQLDLAHLLCWSADFDIERGMYIQALQRALRSLEIFRKLVPEHDERLAAATWLYGRLYYYQAQSANDLDVAAEVLKKALSISRYPSLNFAESAFELAHLYYDQCHEDQCLDMGKASFECWEQMEGLKSVRTLDNMHDYALELAMFGHEDEAIAKWQEIVERCPSSDASEDTKTVYTYRSRAGIAEFQGDAAMAEIFYVKLITLCEVIYNPEHIHVFDYRLSHAEQIMRQGRLEEAKQCSQAILASCDHKSEWRIRASALQTIAECCRLSRNFSEEQTYRLRTLELHKKNLSSPIKGYKHKDTVDAEESLADCYLNSSQLSGAGDLYQKISTWRNSTHGPTHVDTIRAMECLGVCHAHQGRTSEAEAAYLDALGRLSQPDPRLLDSLCMCLSTQCNWEKLEFWSRQNRDCDSEYWPSAQSYLIAALEQQDKIEEALETRAGLLALNAPIVDIPAEHRLPTLPPVRDDRRFGRMIHPRTWSA